jgi:hypothetical protein
MFFKIIVILEEVSNKLYNISKNSSMCEELSIESYADILNDNVALKNKLEKLGVNLDDTGLSVPLNYSDLLTEEEKAFLKKLSDDFNAKYTGDTVWHIKFSDEPGARRMYYSDIICENCYKSLQNIRTHDDYIR